MINSILVPEHATWYFHGATSSMVTVLRIHTGSDEYCAIRLKQCTIFGDKVER